MAASRKKM